MNEKNTSNELCCSEAARSNIANILTGFLGLKQSVDTSIIFENFKGMPSLCLHLFSL